MNFTALAAISAAALCGLVVGGPVTPPGRQKHHRGPPAVRDEVSFHHHAGLRLGVGLYLLRAGDLLHDMAASGLYHVGTVQAGNRYPAGSNGPEGSWEHLRAQRQRCIWEK